MVVSAVTNVDVNIPKNWPRPKPPMVVQTLKPSALPFIVNKIVAIAQIEITSKNSKTII